MAEDIDWNLFNTQAHRTAQDKCACLIACAVDGPTRKAVVEHLDYARRIGDAPAFPLLIARLTGPCCLPPITMKEDDSCPPQGASPLT